MLGTTLDGRYRIDRLLGQGAMGAVYEAEHTGTGRRVAVKVISSGDLTRDEQLVGRFQREAKVAGAIDTQHITQVLDTGVDRETEQPYLVMEFLHGEDLQHLLKRLGQIAPDLALRIIAQACLGLQKAHAAHVVHRDIKPANLFLAQRDAGEMIVKLLDFGIAKVKMDQANDGEGNALTKTGSMLGSPLYMSPEQARGTKTIDHRADIWSLGVVLYQALAGRTPYQHCQALGELIISICHDPPAPVQEFAPWVPREVAAVVHKALRHDANERYQTAQEMFDAIRALLPNGWSISEEMVVSLADTARQQVAPLLSMPPPPIAAARTTTSSPGLDASGSDAASTSNPLVQSQVLAPRREPSKAPLFAGALVIAALAGGGAYLAVKPAPQPPAQAVPASAPPPPVPLAAPPQPTVTPATSEAAPPPAPQAAAAKRVKVVIFPTDATVEVEGVKTPLKGGLLEITGAPGSVHRVRVFKGKNETTADVIVTEEGASPPKVELGAAPAAGKGSGPAAPGAGPKPAPGPLPGIQSKFE